MTVLSHIVFRPELAGCMSIEQEFFLCQPGHAVTPVPMARTFLDVMRPYDPSGRWTYELSACQAEFRTEPHGSTSGLLSDLRTGTLSGTATAHDIGCSLRAIEAAPLDMPVDVYEDDERYRELAKTLPEHVLRAACRVSSVQIHYGCRDIEHAIRVHARLIPHLDHLSAMGDHSGGERLRLYKMMAPYWQPPVYDSVAHFERVAEAEGFASNLKNCWHLIRISRHGTIELRMFGNTEDHGEIRQWVEFVRDIADEA